MDNTEFKKIVQEITSKYGFMYCKKNYYYNSDKIIVVNYICLFDYLFISS